MPSDRFTMLPSTFVDHATGHEWTVAVSEPMSLTAALLYAAACWAGGHTDWRLPSRTELLSLVDDSVHSPATWPALRDCTPSEWFWTSTPYAPLSAYAWYVYFGYGYASNGGVTSTRRVRCVR